MLSKSALFNLFKILIALIFPLYYIITSYFYRYAYDDFSYLDGMSNYGGIWGYAWHMYLTHEGPFLIYLRIQAFYLLPTFIYFILFLSLLFSSFCFFFSSVCKQFEIKISFADNFLISSLIISALYYTAPSVKELWHWMDGTSYTCIYFDLLFALSFFLRKKPLYALPFILFLMHSRITWSIYIFGCYMLFFLYHFYNNKKIEKVYWIIGALMLLALIVYIIAPGNWAQRNKWHSQLALLNEDDASFLLTMKNVFYKLMIKKIPYLILFFIPITLLVKDEFMEKLRLKGIKILLPLMFLILTLISHSILLHLATGRYFYQPRAWSVESFLFVFTFLYYLLQGYLYFKQKVLTLKPMLFSAFKGIALLSIGIYVYLFSKTLFVNLPIIKTYSSEYDKRIAIIQNCKLKKDETLYLDPLPDSGVLLSWGLNPGFQQEFHLPELIIIYHLQCKVVIENKKTN